MVMLMPPYHGATLHPDDGGVYEFFARVAEAVAIPVMVQDAPLSGVTLSVPLLARLARDVGRVSYFKIEVPGTAGKLRALIEAGGKAIVGPFDGEESITLMADLDAGATGTMPSALLPASSTSARTRLCSSTSRQRRPPPWCGLPAALRLPHGVLGFIWGRAATAVT